MEAYTKDLYQFLKGRENKSIATKQSQYMRNKFPFFGLMKDEIKMSFSEFESLNGKVRSEDSINFCRACTQYEEREMWYIGVDVLKKYKKKLVAEDLVFLKELIIKSDWWDIVDLVASNNIGSLVLNFPELKCEVQEWLYDENFWLRRTSIIYQLKYRDQTDVDFLFFACKYVAYEKEFFIRKAIGWALREYSKVNPEAVRLFIEKNNTILSTLSIREGSKYI